MVQTLNNISVLDFLKNFYGQRRNKQRNRTLRTLECGTRRKQLIIPTSSLSVRINFCAAAAAAAGTGTPGFPVTNIGAVGKISAGTRLGETGPR